MRDCAKRIASATLPMTATASALSVIDSVTQSEADSVGQSVMRVAMIRLGAGKRYGGMSRYRTSPSQASSPRPSVKAGTA